MSRNLLLTPGPTKLLPAASAALGSPIIHHRTPQFQENIKEAVEGLQYVFQTKNDIYLLTSSGTGAMEACVANLLSAGDKAITVEGGKFGERWTELCQVYGAQATVIKVPWGKAVGAEQIKEALDNDKDIKVVFTTLTETSTGVTTDIKSIAKVVSKTNAILVVDGISGVGVTEIKTDEWNVDVVVSASHKGFMLPPGLSFISVNEKAFKLIENSTSPRYYFDLRKSKKTFVTTDTPYTPAIGIIVGLCESVKYFKEKGLDNLFEYYGHLAKGTRSATKALGLTLFPDESCISNCLTAINIPEGIDGGKVVKILRDVHGISTAGGQAELKGKIIRIAHMGCVNEEDLITGLSYFEKVLQELGYSFELGAGVNAAKEVFHLSETNC